MTTENELKEPRYGRKSDTSERNEFERPSSVGCLVFVLNERFNLVLLLLLAFLLPHDGHVHEAATGGDGQDAQSTASTDGDRNPNRHPFVWQVRSYNQQRQLSVMQQVSNIVKK